MFESSNNFIATGNTLLSEVIFYHVKGMAVVPWTYLLTLVNVTVHTAICSWITNHYIRYMYVCNKFVSTSTLYCVTRCERVNRMLFRHDTHVLTHTLPIWVTHYSFIQALKCIWSSLFI